MESDMINSSFVEKRKFPRIEKALDLKIESIGCEQIIVGITKNLSCNGVLCHVDKVIPEMTRIEMVLKLPDGNVLCRGTVVRVEKNFSGDNSYDVAIFFDELPESAKKKIEDFVGK